MANSDASTPALINEYAEDYMEKIFYFCLKRTGNVCDAEDLSSDISMNVLSALSRGTVPSRFSAWVWRMAKHRYSVWAYKKRKRSEAVTGSDIGDYELEDTSGSVEDAWIRSEELSLLQRELAFISSDCRSILVAYYIEDTPIKKIAASLTLPEGTVQARLHRARKKLKEGMSMAREFGSKSYKPEEIHFINNCSSFGSKGQPWSILTHAMYKNIFLEIYDNPETAEEISLQLGIALPYIEDELKFLTEQTFLIKRNGKYETAFPIISRRTQELIHDRITGSAGEVTSLLEKLLDSFNAACEREGLNYYGRHLSYEDAKWTLLMAAFDRLSADTFGIKRRAFTRRPDNGNWDIVGYQEAEIALPPYVGLHGCHSGREDAPDVLFQQYKYQYANILAKTPDYITNEHAEILKAAAEGRPCDCDENLIQDLLKYGYLRREEGGYVPCIVVFHRRGDETYPERFSETEKREIKETAGRIQCIIAAVNAYAREAVYRDLSKTLKADAHVCALACANSGFDRRYVLEQALGDGWLKYDENTSRVIGAYLII